MKILSKLALALLALPCCFSLTGKSNLEANKQVEEPQISYEEINLQEKLFRQYYEELNDNVKEKITLEDFKGIYEKSNMPVRNVVKVLNEDFQLQLIYLGEDIVSIEFISAYISVKFCGEDCYLERDDADFIISDNHNRDPEDKKANNYKPKPSSYASADISYTTEQHTCRSLDFFDSDGSDHSPRLPVYYGDINSYNPNENNFEYYYDLVEDGDIVWDPITGLEFDPVNAVTHAGMIVSKIKPGLTTRYDKNPYTGAPLNGGSCVINFIETVEAYASGVRFGFLDDERILKYGTKVLRVRNATRAQRAQACDFMLSQLGKPYFLKILDSSSVPVPNRNYDHWYCTQLVFSAYYHAGVNICENNSKADYYGKNNRAEGNVIGHMIASGENIEDLRVMEERPNFGHDFLRVICQGVSEETINIRIDNLSNQERVVYFNPVTEGIGNLASNFKRMYFEHQTIAGRGFLYLTIDRALFSLLIRSFLCYYVENGYAYCTIVDRFTDGVWWFEPLQYRFASEYNQEYSKILLNGSTDRVEYTPDKFVYHTQYGDSWYEAQVDVPVNDVPEASWEEILDVKMFIPGYNIHIFDKYYWFDSSNGVFHVTLKSDEAFNYGDIYFTYAYRLEYRLDYLTIGSGVKTKFFVGDGFDDTSLHVYAHYTNGTVVEVTSYDVNSDEYNPYTPGEYNITVKFSDNGIARYAQYTVTVSYPTLQLIEFTGSYQTQFYVGDTFNHDGLIVTAYLDDGESYTVNNYVLDSSNVNMDVAGSYPVYVYYTREGVTVSKCYMVTVKSLVLEYISLSGDFQTEFLTDDEFDFSGLIVTAYYNNGSYKQVTDYDIDLSDVDMEFPGDYEVIISYSDCGSTVSESYFITVEERVPDLVAIALTGSYQTTFHVGDTFTYNGLKVVASYDDGNMSFVNNFVVDSSNVNMNVAGIYLVNVSYTENGITKVTSYAVFVE